MIDDKMLAEDEREQKMLANHYANKPEMVVTFKKRIAVIRNARRYLALRENEAIAGAQAGKIDSISCFYAEFDAAADQLLEGGE